MGRRYSPMVPGPIVVGGAVALGVGIEFWHSFEAASSYFALAFGWALILSAIAWMVWGDWELRRHGGTLNPYRRCPRLVCTGPFAYSRHPLYVGLVMVHLGLAIATLRPGLAATVPISAVLLQVLAMVPEEQALRSWFPSQYADYAGRVPRWFSLASKSTRSVGDPGVPPDSRAGG